MCPHATGTATLRTLPSKRYSIQRLHSSQDLSDIAGDRCSGFYHDQGQTPEHAGANQSVYHVDGKCLGQCNCGPINPCAEYTFDHRNASFSEWFVNGYMINAQTLLHKPRPINV